MKRNTTLLAGIVGTLLFVGCASNLDNGGGGEFSGIQYVVMAKKVSPRMDFLFKTNATPSGTTDISDLMIPDVDVEYEVLSIVREHGDMVYSKSIIKKDVGPYDLPEYHTTFYQTDKNSGHTIALDEHSEHRLWAADSRLYEIGNALYRVAGDRTKIDKIGTDGSVIGAAEYPAGVDAHSPYGSVQVDGTIIISTQKKTFRYDPSNDTFTYLNGLNELEIIEMVEVDDRLYFFGKTEEMTGYALYVFYLPSPATQPTMIAHYENRFIKPGSMKIHDHKLYYIAVEGQHYSPYVLSGTEATRIAGLDLPLLDAKAYFLAFNGSLYLPSGNTLYKMDPNTHQASVAISFIGDNSVYPVDQVLYYAGKDAAHGTELWKYDGSQHTLVHDINPGAGSSHPLHVIKLNGRLVFQAAADGIRNKLYSLDGTTLTPLN